VLVERENVPQASQAHELEAHAVYEAQASAILPDQPAYPSTVELVGHPVDRQERHQMVLEIPHRRQTDAVLEEGDRLDQDVGRGVQIAALLEQPPESPDNLRVPVLCLDEQGIEPGRVQECAQRR
jgi:hypothetical protein